MNPRDIIWDHYRPNSKLAGILLEHSERVTDKALKIAQQVAHLNPDLEFIAEAAMLHDIGIAQTEAAQIGCRGPLPYVCHGIAGRELLEPYHLPQHGLVCERHVGVGITVADIETQQLPMPMRDMVPVSLEETIICYADKFFSKKIGAREHPFHIILEDLGRYGQDKIQRFLQWHRQFSIFA